jgi:hypothetical protein
MNIILALIFFACEDKEKTPEPKRLSNTSAIEYHPPLMPEDGVVLSSKMSLDKCLEELPSCQCEMIEEEKDCYPQFVSEILPIPHLMQEEMKGVSWQESCPVSLDDLRLLKLLHWTETGGVQWGQLIFHKGVVKAAEKVFMKLYSEGFPIHQIKPAHMFDGSDDASMVANNTVAFNCREKKVANKWAEHSYGEAVDINPLWNPWVKGSKVLPKEGKPYADRSNRIPGMINKGDSIIEIMSTHGWNWGSKKTTIQSYQNFSRENSQFE